MVIEIDLKTAPASVQLVEPDDFKSFKILARGDATSLAGGVTDLGRLDANGDVYVDVQALKALAGDRGQDREWLQSFDGMVAYARDHGWTDDTGAIQAHVEWAD
jgi:hypothetical protein